MIIRTKCLVKVYRDCVEIVTYSPEDTQQIGRILGSYAEAGHVYLLSGALGSGKTCFTQGILWGLDGKEFARSPTFVLLAEYEARIPLYHADLYRLGSEIETIELGIEEYIFGDGVCVIEWADRAPEYLDSVEHIAVMFNHVESDHRRVTISHKDHKYDRAVNAIKTYYDSNRVY